MELSLRYLIKICFYAPIKVDITRILPCSFKNGDLNITSYLERNS